MANENLKEQVSLEELLIGYFQKKGVLQKESNDLASDSVEVAKKQLSEKEKEMNLHKQRLDHIKSTDTLMGSISEKITAQGQGWEGITGAQAKLLEGHKVSLAAANEQFEAGVIDKKTYNERVALITELSSGTKNLVQLTADLAKIDNEIAFLNSLEKDNNDAARQAKIDELMTRRSIVSEAQGQAATEDRASALKEERLKSADALTGGMASKMKNFAKEAKKPGALLTMGIGLAIAALVAFSGITDKVGDQFGAMGVQDFRGEIISASADAQKLGFSFEETATVINAMSSDFGATVGEASALTGEILDVAKALNMTAADSAKLVGTIASTTQLTGEGAVNLIRQTGALAKSAGIAPTAVFADMAGSSEVIAAYTDETGENIGMAAVRARQMGMSLGDVAKIADGLLSVETSIQKEMEAEVMLGRDLNLDRARQLALAGDLVGVQEEILGQVGSEAEFNEMNVLERRALADAIGIGVDQLGKMVTESGKSREELAKMRGLDVSEIIGSEAISNITLMTNNLKAFGTSMMAGLAHIATFGGSLEGIGGTITTVLVVALGAAALAFGFFYIKGLLASLAIKAVGRSGLTAAPGLVSLGTAGSTAIPVLLTIALVGVALMGVLFGIGFVLKQIPPIIVAVATGFVSIIAAVSALIIKFTEVPFLVPIIFGLSLAFFALAASLVALSMVGILVIPVFFVLVGLGAALAIFGTGLAVVTPQLSKFSVGIENITTTLRGATEMIMPIFALSGALMGLGVTLLYLTAISVPASIGLIMIGGSLAVFGLGLAIATPNLGTFIVSLSGLGTVLEVIQPHIKTIMALSVALMGLGVSLSYFTVISVPASIGLVTMGVSLMVFGTGLGMVTPHLETFAVGMTSIMTTLEGTTAMTGPIFSLSASLFGLSIALAAVGTAGIFALPAFAMLKGLGLLGGGEKEEAGGEEEVALVKDDVVSGQLQSVVNAINEMKTQVITAINDSPRQIGKETSRGLLAGVGI